jgi:hypothetical protein
MCGLSKASQWQSAQALYVIGSLGASSPPRNNRHSELSLCVIVAANIVSAFYAATFPGLVRDLPRLIQSENDVAAGTKSCVPVLLDSTQAHMTDLVIYSAEDHAELDMYERAQVSHGWSRTLSVS